MKKKSIKVIKEKNLDNGKIHLPQILSLKSRSQRKKKGQLRDQFIKKKITIEKPVKKKKTVGYLIKRKKKLSRKQKKKKVAQ